MTSEQRLEALAEHLYSTGSRYYGPTWDERLPCFPPRRIVIAEPWRDRLERWYCEKSDTYYQSNIWCPPVWFRVISKLRRVPLYKRIVYPEQS